MERKQIRIMQVGSARRELARGAQFLAEFDKVVNASMKPEFMYQGHRENVRLEHMLIVMESAGQDLERSTRRFREANDKLEAGLKRTNVQAR